jgi:aldehyde dehydrogenase
MSIIEQSPIVDPADAGIESRYENFIGGAWVAPTTGEYHDNVTPATGRPFTQVPYSGLADIELALDAAHAAKDAWGDTSATARAKVLNRIADVIEENLETLAIAESYDNG